MEIKFDNRVAIITGAGAGLGRAHALELARRGVAIVVNDLGGAVDGTGGSTSAAEAVAQEIIEGGGRAIAHGANVTKADEVDDMVAQAQQKFGRIDILVNNAGILRDKSFAKMSVQDFQAVLDVHLLGSTICTKAVWEIMREQHYGRIAMTSSSSGLYGNFGQSNYGAAKMGLIGLMNVLAIEGAKYDIRINALAPVAATRMTEGLFPGQAAEILTVESVTAGLVPLVCDEAPNRLILCAGGGGYAATRIVETDGIYLTPDQQTPENVAARLDEITDMAEAKIFTQGGEQGMKFVSKAMAAKG